MAWHQITYRTYVCRSQLSLPALLSTPRIVETQSSLVPDDVSGTEHSASSVVEQFVAGHSHRINTVYFQKSA